MNERQRLVLLVEDHDLNRYLARYVLEQAGLRVVCAGDGEQALALARAELPDVVLMDLRLPVMDGYETTRRFKADPALAGVPVIALSAQAMDSDLARARAAGCVAHLGKPFEPADLVALVGAHLGPR